MGKLIDDKRYMNIEDEINNVAIYLRKSRGEDIHVLDNHLKRLKIRSNANGWKYTVYKEIGSGASIDGRIEIKKLLNDIKDKIYDAVLVVDVDRLSRGDGLDNEIIMRALKESSTLLVVDSPYQVLDLNLDTDEDMMIFKSVISRMEYKQIIKRHREGKKIAQYMGKWINSSAPYGYDIDRKSKKLVVNENESKIIIKMKNLLIDKNWSSAKIAKYLNDQNILTKKGNKWAPNVVGRTLKNEVYIGNMIYNKVTTDPITKKAIKLPESKHKRVENTHPPLFTIVDRKKILERIKLNTTPKNNHIEIRALTGLVFSPENYKYIINKSGGYVYFTIDSNNMNYDSEIRKKYKAVKYDLIKDIIIKILINMKENIDNKIDQNTSNENVENLKIEINRLSKKAQKLDAEKQKIIEGFLIGLYDNDKSIELNTKKDDEIKHINEEIGLLNNKLKMEAESHESKLTKIEKVIYNLKNNINGRVTNELLKVLVNKIIVSRKEQDDIQMKIILN